MGYKCNDCGNYESFEAEENYTEWGHRTVYINGDGDIDDWGDSNIDDSDGDGDFREVECSECNSRNVEWYDEDFYDNTPKKIINWENEL